MQRHCQTQSSHLTILKLSWFHACWNLYWFRMFTETVLCIIEELDSVSLISKSYLTNVGVKLQINLSYKKHTIKQIPWHSFINNPSVSIKTFLGFQTEFLHPLMAVMITVFSRNNVTFISSQEERCLLGHCVIVETSNLDWKYLNPSLFI